MRSRILPAVLLMAAFLFAGRALSAQELPDSASLATIEASLDEYFSSMERADTRIKQKEASYIIETTPQGKLRDWVALKVYNHYLSSKLMGDEAVAIKVAEDWFFPGKVSFPTEVDLLNARIYAEFNSQSLIGNKAPSLLLESLDGQNIEALGDDGTSHAAPSDRYRVLFFYATDCPTCKAESVLLGRLLEGVGYPLDFYAINLGTNRDEWRQYREERLSISSPSVRVYHWWDPEGQSNMQLKYGLLQTPGMFLLDKGGYIVGRKLDTEALAKLLEAYVAPKELSYGSEDSAKYYDRVFSALQDGFTKEDVLAVQRHIYSSTIGEEGPSRDETLYRQMTGDLLYYISSKNGSAFKLATPEIAQEYILDRPDIWSSRDDTLKVVTMATLLRDMTSRNPVGSVLPDRKVSATLMTWNKTRKGKYSPAKIGGDSNYLVVYSPTCSQCKENMEAIRAILAEGKSEDKQVRRAARGMRFLLVDEEQLMKDSPDDAYFMLDSYDLSSLPLILQTDSRGRVVERYVSLVE